MNRIWGEGPMGSKDNLAFPCFSSTATAPSSNLQGFKLVILEWVRTSSWLACKSRMWQLHSREAIDDVITHDDSTDLNWHLWVLKQLSWANLKSSCRSNLTSSAVHKSHRIFTARLSAFYRIVHFTLCWYPYLTKYLNYAVTNIASSMRCIQCICTERHRQLVQSSRF